MADVKTIEQAREMMEETSGEDVQHQKFEDGFTVRTVIGAFFVGLIMMPGAMYMGLVAGDGLGPAAQWVTVVLFSELARRSFAPLKRQEIYMLMYMSAGVAGGVGGVAGMIWNQYLVQCPQIGDLAKLIPTWVAPYANDPSLSQRTFLTHAWVVPICLMIFNEIAARMIAIGGGYAIFKLTSDIERLPFPMAPIAAAGATALAEAGTKEDSWRWQVFSTGTVLGLIFGFVYVFVPVVTGVLFPKPVQLIPIPFIDFTSKTEHILPAAWSALSGDLGKVIVGFVIPFPILLGTFISSVACQIGINPVLYHLGMFPDWTPGTPYIQTRLATSIDFWMSVGIGTGLGIGCIGLGSVLFALKKMSREAARPTMARTVAHNRGDWAIKWSIAAWAFAIIAQIFVCHWLVPEFPVWIFCFYGLIYTPVISYVSGRLIGLTGQGVGFPYIREATIIKSGYREADIWFAGIPMHDVGAQAQFFREVELVGVRFNNIIKAEILKLIIVLPASFVFWSFFWKTSPIPSAQYPFVQRMWPVNATMASIWWTANKQSLADNWLFMAIRPSVIIGAGIGTFVLFAISTLFKLPILFFYGFMGGIQGEPMNTVPMFVGACLGKFYFQNRFGEVKWGQYAPVLTAGFGCGTGLTAMTGIAFALITKSVNYLGY